MSSEAFITLVAAGACTGLFLFASARASRPADPLKPRLLPWRAITVTAGAAGFVVMAYLLSLLAPGLTAPTGSP